jgi:hypothetical protein
MSAQKSIHVEVRGEPDWLTAVASSVTIRRAARPRLWVTELRASAVLNSLSEMAEGSCGGRGRARDGSRACLGDDSARPALVNGALYGMTP